MMTTTRLLGIAGIACVFLASGCATTDSIGTYNPTAKFSQMAPAQPMLITGSRIRSMVSPDDVNPPTALPVTVITREAIDNSGAVSVQQVLMRHVPNMIRRFPGDN